jgi:putative ABC transport system permease protein
VHALTSSQSTAPAADWRLAIVLVVLLVVAAAVSRVGGLAVEREQVVAAVRAVVQLAVVSAVIAAVLASLPWSFAFALLMLLVASGTSAHRLDVPRRQFALVGAAVAAGAVPVVALCLASGVIPLNGAGIIPIAGILVGGAMTACTLTGRRAFQELEGRRGSYEAALALGLGRTEAAYLVIQPTAREALTPGIDQTRTVGLVTLPGAFVGVLLGGGTAVEAGAAQVLVLVALLAVQSVTAAAVLRLVASGALLPDGLAGLPR